MFSRALGQTRGARAREEEKAREGSQCAKEVNFNRQPVDGGSQVLRITDDE